MKAWIFFIIKINEKLNSLTKIEDRYIEQFSLRTFSSSQKIFEEILYHINKKIRYINLRVMYNEFRKELGKKSFDLLNSYISGKSALSIAREIFCSKTQIFRLIGEWTNRCKSCLELLGYTECKLEQEYKDLEIYKKAFEKRYSSNK